MPSKVNFNSSETENCVTLCKLDNAAQSVTDLITNSSNNSVILQLGTKALPVLFHYFKENKNRSTYYGI